MPGLDVGKFSHQVGVLTATSTAYCLRELAGKTIVGLERLLICTRLPVSCLVHFKMRLRMLLRQASESVPGKSSCISKPVMTKVKFVVEFRVKLIEFLTNALFSDHIFC